MHFRWQSNYQEEEEEGWDQINQFIPTPFCVPEFPMSYVVVLFVFNNVRQETVARLVNIVGFIDHHCLKSLS